MSPEPVPPSGVMPFPPGTVIAGGKYRVNRLLGEGGMGWVVVATHLQLEQRVALKFMRSAKNPEAVARFGGADVSRLLADAAIVRNRAKIEATLANARATVALRATEPLETLETLETLVRAHAPPSQDPPPSSWTQTRSTTPQTVTLARELKRRGFRFVGPTTLYALMQACGLVNDHLADCPARAAVQRARQAAGLR